MRDKRTLDEYRENLVGDRRIVPRLLALFDEFGIRATWAFVGFLFYRRRTPRSSAESWSTSGTFAGPPAC